MRHKNLELRLLILLFLVFAFSMRSYAIESKDEISSVISGVQEYINRKFEEAIVETYPFPHLVISNIFPQKLYDDMCKLWPEKNEFVPQGARSVLPVN